MHHTLPTQEALAGHTVSRPQEHWLDSPSLIHKVLSALRARGEAITLQCELGAQTHPTRLLKINLHQRVLLLEGIPTSDEQRLLLDGATFTLHARLHGIQLTIPGNRVLRVQQHPTCAAYQVTYPDGFYCLQRRKFLRHNLPPLYQTELNLTIRETQCQATLADISIGGCRLALTGDHTQQLAPQLTLHHCKAFISPLHGPLHFDGQVCFSQYDRSADLTFCGIRFDALHGDSAHHLHALLRELDTFKRRRRKAPASALKAPAHTHAAPEPPSPSAAAPQRLDDYIISYQRDQVLRQQTKQLLDVAQQHAQLIQLMRNTFNAVRRGEPVQAAPLEEQAARLVELTLAQRDDLLCIDCIRSQRDYQYEHTVGVSILLTLFGQYLQQDAATLRQLALGGLLLDLGKAKLPVALLEKRTALNAEETLAMRQHIPYGVQLLEELGFTSPIIRAVVEQHHERYDGAGYPAGLRADTITLHGRMAAIVDAYDAMTSTRQYRSAIPPAAALQRLLREGDRQFDKALTYQFIRCLGVFPVGSYVQLRDGHLAQVRKLDQRGLPREIIVSDQTGHTVHHPRTLALDTLTKDNLQQLLRPLVRCSRRPLELHLLQQAIHEQPLCTSS